MRALNEDRLASCAKEQLMRCLCVCIAMTMATFVSLPASEKKPEGQALFNGKDLKGWKFRGGDNAKAKSKWAVVGRALLDPNMPGKLFGPAGDGGMLNGRSE